MGWPLRLWALIAVVVVIDATTVTAQRKADLEPCPRGCRCSAVPRNQGRHKWHRLLAAYRMQSIVYGPRQAGGQSRPRESRPPVIMRSSTNELGGREMTCLGLQNMPEDVPADISKMTFYGDSKGYLHQQDSPSSGIAYASNVKKRFPKSYQQLTTIRKFAFNHNGAAKELNIEGNRIKMLHASHLEMLSGLRSLRMRNNRMQVVNARALRGLRHLEELDLSRNHLRRLPKSTLYDVTRLRVLRLNKNRLRVMHVKLFSKLAHLEVLDLSENGLKDIRKDAFLVNANLRELRVDYNQLRHIRPHWFASLQSLERLSLRGNRLRLLAPHAFAPLGSLLHMDLDENEAVRLRAGSLSGLRRLKSLRLSRNNISVIESGVFKDTPSLQVLTLASNRIGTLKDGMLTGLSHIRTLSLARNNLLDLPHSALQPIAETIERLDASHNAIKTIRRRNFFGLENLRELRLDHNEIRVVEDESFAITLVNTFAKLTWLYFDHNQLRRIGEDTLYGVPYLKFFTASGNQIETIAASAFSKLKRLNTLVLDGNKLTSIPVAVFKHLRYLQQLNLASNHLTELVDSNFLGLDRVEDVNLSGNEIARVSPNLFENTPRLLSLNLRDNRLKSINLALLEVTPKLKYLELSRNELHSVYMPAAFQRQLFYASFSDNRLETLNANVTETIAFGGALRLYGNPWNCDCALQWLRDAGNMRGLQMTDSGDIVCKSPEFLAGEKVKSLQYEDFRCGHEKAHSLYNDHQPATEAATAPTSMSCDFMEHARQDNTPEHIKMRRHDVMSWYTIFIDSKGNELCSGVRLGPHWILTRSDCWKSPTASQNKIRLQFGRPLGVNEKRSLPEVKIDKVEHFAGSLDLAMVRVSAVRGDHAIRQRVFPCLLSEGGYVTAIHSRRHGVLISRAAHREPAAEVKTAALVLGVQAQHVCAANELCVDGSKVDDAGHDIVGTPYFMKIGRSRWALAAVNARRKDAGNIALQAVFSAIPWIEKIVRL